MRFGKQKGDVVDSVVTRQPTTGRASKLIVNQIHVNYWHIDGHIFLDMQIAGKVRLKWLISWIVYGK